MTVLNTSVSQYRSDIREIAHSVLRSRTTQVKRVKRLNERVQELESEIACLRQAHQASQFKLSQTEQLIQLVRAENQRLKAQPIQFPTEPAIPRHSYGAKMICLCLKLVQRIGFRPARAALEIFSESVGAVGKIPTSDVMRTWACRVGIAILHQEDVTHDDEIWMSDHSNQIGPEKILTILKIRASDLPPRGETLKRSKLKAIAVVPGKEWKRDDVRREYAKLASQRGAPRYLLTDGAVELHETADVLQKPGKRLTVMRDMKHKAANILEKLIGKSERFAQYLSGIGRTRSQVQQTEISHFTPPAQRAKARFMNLKPMLHWGEMVAFHLATPFSDSRSGITAQRMNEKLGWVRGFHKDLLLWSECQKVMEHCLSFIGRQGVERGTAARLQASLESTFPDWSERLDVSQEMGQQLAAFVLETELQLAPDERTWLLTDNLESSFGAFKRLEGQHSKGGFTSLIASLPMLLTELTPANVKESLLAVPVEKMKAWVKDNLGQTLSAKRNRAYAELANSTSR